MQSQIRLRLSGEKGSGICELMDQGAMLRYRFTIEGEPSSEIVVVLQGRSPYMNEQCVLKKCSEFSGQWQAEGECAKLPCQNGWMWVLRRGKIWLWTAFPGVSIPWEAAAAQLKMLGANAKPVPKPMEQGMASSPLAAAPAPQNAQAALSAAKSVPVQEAPLPEAAGRVAFPKAIYPGEDDIMAPAPLGSTAPLPASNRGDREQARAQKDASPAQDPLLMIPLPGILFSLDTGEGRSCWLARERRGNEEWVWVAVAGSGDETPTGRFRYYFAGRQGGGYWIDRRINQSEGKEDLLVFASE